MIMKLLGYPSKEQKLYIAGFLLFFSYLLMHYLLEFNGRDFPQQSELRYSTGILEYSRAPGKNSLSFIILQPIERTDKKMAFGCSYSVALSSAGSCMDLKSTEPYAGKTARVGWYRQSKFLGFENRLPQLVTLEVEGKHVKTYEGTYELLNRLNKSNTYTTLFFMALSIFLFVFCFYPKKQEAAD